VKKTFLVVTDQANSIWVTTVKASLKSMGEIKIIPKGDVLAELTQIECEMVILDYSAANDIVPFITEVHAKYPGLPIVVAALTRGWRRARETLRAGARDYILKSLTADELEATIRIILSDSETVDPLPSKQSQPGAPRATILFADNDKDFLATRREFLEKAGYVVKSALKPAQAKHMLEAGGIDLAILDIRLDNNNDPKDISGLRLAKSAAPDIPKIILTNYPDSEYVREALRPQLDGLQAAVDFLSKAEGATILLKTIEDILKTASQKQQGSSPSVKVFIAHGHDTDTLAKVKEFLRGVGVKPIILFEEADRGDTIIEKLERCCSEAAFAIVLFTPDDYGYSKEEPIAVKHRARQNVIFELGYLAARLGRRRVRVIYQPGVEIPTDFMGVLYIEMDKSGRWKAILERELRDAGIIER
jgi:predicted nucleotide-binding protein